MSIRSLTALAVARDKAESSQPAMGGGGRAAAPGDAAAPEVPQQFADVLISAIPSEALAAYTAVLGVTVGVIEATHPRAYLLFRWWSFAAFLVVTVLAVAVSYRRKVNGPGGVKNADSRRAFPWLEGLSALIAAAAWGLAMPGSALNVQLGGTVRTLATTTIVVGGAAILGLALGPQLKSGTSKPGDQTSRSGDSQPTQQETPVGSTVVAVPRRRPDGDGPVLRADLRVHLDA